MTNSPNIIDADFTALDVRGSTTPTVLRLFDDKSNFEMRNLNNGVCDLFYSRSEPGKPSISKSLLTFRVDASGNVSMTFAGTVTLADVVVTGSLSYPGGKARNVGNPDKVLAINTTSGLVGIET